VSVSADNGHVMNHSLCVPCAAHQRLIIKTSHNRTIDVLRRTVRDAEAAAVAKPAELSRRSVIFL